MTDAELDQESAVTGTDTAMGTDKVPAADTTTRPEPQVQDEEVDTGDDLALLADDGEADEPADGEGAEAGDAKATNAPQHDREAYVYEPPEGAEVTEIGRGRIDAFAEYAHKNGMAPEAYQGAITFYNDLVRQEQARLAEGDKSLRTETRDGQGTIASCWCAPTGQQERSPPRPLVHCVSARSYRRAGGQAPVEASAEQISALQGEASGERRPLQG